MLGNIASSYPQAVYGALSNACGAYVRRVCTINECSNDFKVQLGADEVSQPKPFPDGLLQCASSLAIEPSSCLYIGDSPTDGQAAKAAGMRSIGVTWGSHPSQSVESAFDVTVHDVPSLERAIRDTLES
jgi:beta-phosphoglucomutase-like phosphatase (HAD superfamily)